PPDAAPARRRNANTSREATNKPAFAGSGTAGAVTSTSEYVTSVIGRKEESKKLKPVRLALAMPCAEFENCDPTFTEAVSDSVNACGTSRVKLTGIGP